VALCGRPRYYFVMRLWMLPLALPVAATLAIGFAAAADGDIVPVYTGEDLDRMFGPAPPGPSDPVDKTRPEDWRQVEQFLDREYARIDADRRHDLDRREIDASSRREDDSSRLYGSMIWGGYPWAWWNGGDRRVPPRGGVVAFNGPRGGVNRAVGGSRAGNRPVSPSRAIAHGAGRVHGHGGRPR
jgi:hypothetical protein